MAQPFLLQRVVLLDSDMIVMRSMDELMELDLASDWIAAAHACACNPRKFAHYPKDWWVLQTSTSCLDQHETGSRRIAHIPPFVTQLVIPSQCR
jgi:alpha-N-acetylglucosamine transferase